MRKDAAKRYLVHKKIDMWEVVDRSIAHNPIVHKYHPSVRLLSSFIDKGLMLDLEGWYTITPEHVTELVIRRVERARIDLLISSKAILCAYCGVGGDALVFLRKGYDVMCYDLVYRKIKYLKHNYQVVKKDSENVGKLFCATKDFFEIERTEFPKQPFLAFVAPPWGGVEYKREPVYSPENMGLSRIHEKMKKLVDNVIYFLPRNCDYDDLRGVFGKCEIQMTKLSNRHLALLVYCGPIFN